MRYIVLSAVMAIGFGAVTAFAQMSGGTMSGMQHEGMG
jgi:hypothetical protein